jgi:hypothetical protein
MPSSYGRSVAVATFVFVLTFSPYAHAAENGAVTFDDPFTDAIQLWSAVLSSIETLSHQFASVLQTQSSVTASNSPKPHVPKNLTPPALTASAVLATEPLPETVANSESASAASSTPQQQQSRSPPETPPATNNSSLALAAATPASAFVTQSQFDAALSALGTSVREILVETNANPTPEYIAGDGNNANPYAAASAIDNLSNVTIENSTITGGISGLSASDIPALDYLSLDGGALAGDLLINGNATTTDLFASDATAGTFTVTGTSTLASIILSNINCSTYGNGGKLTTDSSGNIVCAADQGGSGSTVAGANGQIQFNGLGSFGASSALTFATSTGTLTTPTVSSTNASTTNATSTTLFSTLANFTTAIATTFNASVANIVGITATNSTTTNATTTTLYAGTATIPSLTASNATSTNLAVTGSASTSALVASNSLTIGNLTGFLKATAGAVATSLVNLTTDVTGILPIGNGGTATSTAPSYGQVLVGNAAGGYNLVATSSLGITSAIWGNIAGTLANQTDLQNAFNAKFSLSAWYATTTDALAEGTNNKYFTNARAQSAISVSGAPLTYSSGVIGINQANASQPGFLASSDWTTFNGKLASSSLATSALLAGLVSDHTGSGALAFATSPTFAGTPVFGGGVINDSVDSTTTVPNGTSYAWTVATSTSASPLIEVDTSGSSGSVSIGGGSASGSAVVLGATGEPANLVFAASSTIEGAGTGQLITLGANSDVFDFGVNLGIGTTTPAKPLTIDSSNASGTAIRISNSSSGGHIFDLLSSGSANTGGAGRFDIFDVTSGLARLSVQSAGNVGIGTTTPGSIFSINGVANWTGATSTIYSTGGINLSSGCFSINGTCITGGGTTYTFSYPLVNSANNISESWGTTTANIWNQLQTFTSGLISNGSSTINGTATITGQATLGNASSSNLTVSGEGFFGTASTTNLTISGITNGSGQCLQINSAGLVTGTGSGCGGSGGTPGGSSGALQFNNSGAFGGAANLFWDSTNNRLGVGTSSPYAELTVATPNGASGSVTTLFAVASSTSAATTTLFSISNTGYADFNGSVGLGTTSSASLLTVVGGTTILDTGGYSWTTGGEAATYSLKVGSDYPLGGLLIQGSNNAAVTNNRYLDIYNKFGTQLFEVGDAGITIGGTARVTATPGFESGVGINSSGVPDYSTFSSALLADPAALFYDERNTTYTDRTIPLVRFAGGGNGQPNTALSTGGINAVFASSTTGLAFLTYASTTGTFVENMRMLTSGSGSTTLGIGTTTPYARLTVWGPDAASTSAFVVANSASTTEFAVYDTGNAILAGSLTQNSDQRLKTNIQSLGASSSLAAIDALNPVTFDWIDPNKGPTPQFGFIAQQVLPIFPNLVSTTSATALTPDGTLSLNYIDLISPMVSAIQALSADITSIENTITGFAQSITTQVLSAATGNFSNELCVGSTCVTPTQFQAMVAAANQSGGSSAAPSSPDNSNSASTTPDTPPVLQINGDNPAFIQVGSAYNDLGATITGPQADLNLGITTYVNGTEMSPVQVDTSTAATDTIDYVVTDSTGLTSTSTRSVIVEAPIAPPSAPGSTASTTEDTATTTTP